MHRIPLLAVLLFACGGDKSDDSAAPTTTTTTTSVVTSETGLTTTVSTTSTTTTAPQPVDFCPAWAVATGTVLTLGPADVADLQATLDGLSAGDTLALQDGTYVISGLNLDVAGVTLRSSSGDASAVVLDGNNTAQWVLGVFADDITVADLTVTKASDTGILVRGTSTADVSGTTLYNVIARDNPKRGVRVESLFGNYADDGLLACSEVSLTDTGRTRVRDLCDTGGIELREAMGWTLRDNTVEGFWCETDTARPALTAWRGSRDTQILRNALRDNTQGISLGQTAETLGRNHTDQPCGGAPAQHFGGLVANNTVWNYRSELLGSASGVLYGIAMDSACESLVLHNTVYSDAAPTVAAIVHRYPNTSGSVQNNLVSHTVVRQDNATTSAVPNLENEPATSFQQVTSGDLHLAPAANNPVDTASVDWLVEVPDDIDGIARDAAPDFGADER